MTVTSVRCARCETAAAATTTTMTTTKTVIVAATPTVAAAAAAAAAAAVGAWSQTVRYQTGMIAAAEVLGRRTRSTKEPMSTLVRLISAVHHEAVGDARRFHQYRSRRVTANSRGGPKACKATVAHIDGCDHTKR